MRTTSIITTILSTALLASAVPQGPVSSCTFTLDKEPPEETACTFKSHTATATASIDCEGCSSLTTLELGVGLPCRTVTTIPGTQTYTSTVCKKSKATKATTSAPATTSTCTTAVGPFPALNLGSTLTTFKTTVTTTSVVSCGGCVLSTRHLGPGPARSITTTTTLPATTVTAYACASTSY